MRQDEPIRYDTEGRRSTIIFFGTNHIFADRQSARTLRTILAYWDLSAAERETCEFWLAMKTLAEAARK